MGAVGQSASMPLCSLSQAKGNSRDELLFQAFEVVSSKFYITNSFGCEYDQHSEAITIVNYSIYSINVSIKCLSLQIYPRNSI